MKLKKIWKGKENKELAHEKCINLIKKRLIKLKNTKNDDTPVKIIDMGCGLSHIAQYFCKQERKTLYKNRRVYNFSINSNNFLLEFINIDHKKHPLYPNHIDIIEMNMKNITKKFDDMSIDIIVFCASLWGTKNDIEDYIENSRRILKSDGYLIIVDHLRNKIGSKKEKQENLSKSCFDRFEKLESFFDAMVVEIRDKASKV